MSNNKIIGERIREARKAAGLSQEQLAKKIGVWQPTLSDWERGGVDIRIAALTKLADGLGIPLAQLIGGES